MSDDLERPTGTTAAPRRRRRWPWLAAAVSLTVLAVSGAGWGVLHEAGNALGRVDAFRGVRNRPPDDGALTLLLVGTDDRDGIPQHELRHVLHAGGRPCHCTDTLMLVHLGRTRSRATVVSIPRDSYVTVPAHTDPATGKPVGAVRGKINAAYGMGGAPLTVQTVEQATGIRVDHYLQVGFHSLVATVDALGGVDVCTSVPLHDPYAGLDLPAGPTRLDGAGALAYVRARHVDGSDFGRMQRQQRLVAQILRRATDGSALLDPARLARVLRTALASVRADPGLSARDLLDLASADARFTTVPVADAGHTVPGWGSTVLWDGPAARALFDAVRHDRPLPARAPAADRPAAHGRGGLTVPPGQVSVQVLNGTRTPGLGTRVDTDLRRGGFATTGLAATATGPGAARTVVRYDPRWDESVKTVAAALPHARLVQVPGLGPTVQVVAGSDYTRPSPVTAGPAPHFAASSTTCA